MAQGLYLALLAFGISLVVIWPADSGLRRLDVFASALIVLGLLVVGAAGDMLAVAAAAGEEAALHAMATRRRPGARGALALKRRADHVVSIAGDIVGDVAGTVSGAAAMFVAMAAAERHHWPETVAVSVAVAAVAAVAVGLKATLKGVAIREANRVLHTVGYVSYFWHRLRRGALLKGRGGR